MLKLIKSKYNSIPFFVIFVLLFSISESGLSQRGKYQFGDYIQFARQELDKENYTEAIKYLNSAISHRPASYEGYFLRGIAKYYLDDMVGAEQDFTESVKYDPYNSDIYHFRAISRVMQYNFGGGLADYARAVELNDKNPLFYLNRARAYLFLQEYDSSISDLNRVFKLKYSKAEVFVLRAMAWRELEKYDEAMEDLDKAIKKDPGHTNAYIQQGSVWMDMKKPDSAIVAFNRALTYNADDSYALFNRALAYMESEDSSNAFKDLNKVIELSPYNSYAYYNRAILKIDREDLKGAIQDLDKVVSLNPDNIVVYLYRGKIKRGMGDLKGAIRDFDKAIEIYPEFADAYMERSEVKKQMMDLKGADKDFELAYLINDFNFQKADSIKLSEEMYLKRLMAFSGEFKTKKSDPGSEIISEADIDFRPVFFSVQFTNNIEGVRFFDSFSKENYHASVITLTNNDKKIDSKATQSELEKPDPGNQSDGLYYLRKADLNANIQDYTSALTYYEQAILFDPQLIMAYFGRANTQFNLIDLLSMELEEQSLMDPKADLSKSYNPYSRSSEDFKYEMVLNDYGKVIELDPNFQFAWFNRGNVKAILGDYWGAVSDYTKALEIDPEFADAYFNKGLILIYLNVKSVGCKDMSRAGELGIYSSYQVLKRFCN
ncbi:MAG: tetratricopeptide repeat protein [Bacteroidales bacterium]